MPRAGKGDQRGGMGRVQSVHFIGIGGAGMGGIAEVLHNLGYAITGSDIGVNAMVRHLQEQGVEVQVGHAAENVADADVVVYSTAVAADNPEMIAARERRIPIVPRAQMLAELMRFRHGIAIAGTHGKTTTTSLVASLLYEGGMDPTFVVGGRVNSIGTNARLGEGRFLVAEADESDASFLHLTPVTAVVTNIDLDHMDTYQGDPEKLRAAFLEFLQRLPFYGLAVLCIDDPILAALSSEVGRPVITYGTSAESDYRAHGISQNGLVTRFSVAHGSDEQWMQVTLNLPGRHNVLNALAAIAVAIEAGVSKPAILKALAEFHGVGRRFQIHGDLRIAERTVMLVDDYGHHPTELAATIAALREGWPRKRVVVAFQPHRYTRTRDLIDDFARVLCEVDALLLLEVYAAGEHPIVGADGRALARAIRNRGKVDPIFVADPAELYAALPNVLRDGDALLILGAGSIGSVVQGLLDRFAARPKLATVGNQ